MQYHDAKLLATAANESQWPAEEYPEVIFAGRSNAGKSTLINALCNRKNLAYSGKTPGKTRLLNFFLVDNKVVFTDCPGYGYATSDAKSALAFEKLIDPYFRNRNALKGMVLVADARREPSKDDLTMIEYGRANHLAIIIALTKADKLSKSQLNRSVQINANQFKVSPKAIIPCASLKKEGMDALWEKIEQMCDTRDSSED